MSIAKQIDHYERIMARAIAANYPNADKVIAECRWHIERIEQRAAESKAKWTRLKQLKKSRGAAGFQC